MDPRLEAFFKRFPIPSAGQQELLSLVQELNRESIEVGSSVVQAAARDAWTDDDTIIPESDTESSGPTGFPNLVRGLAASKRYEDLGCLGIGSMGEVRKVRDRHLKRVVAMKVLRSELIDDFSLLARFIEEAQATAQLQHPQIIPLHDLGQFEDGRYYFTMKEIKGQTMAYIVEQLHQHSRYHGRWMKTEDGWTFRKLLGAFNDVCKAVGYAHSRGVLHRDIKPDNVMLGAHGEVLVLDWGLVKVKGPDVLGTVVSEEGAVETDRAKQKRFATKVGIVTGTPMYMSPEQATGLGQIDARSDVYALGALLYELLSGRPPYIADTFDQVMELLMNEPPPPLIVSPEELQQIWAVNPYFRPPLPLPEELVEICERAMARRPESRYQDAYTLAQAIEDWLEGDQRREQAQKLVGEAQQQRLEVEQLHERVESLREMALQREKQVEPWASEEQKQEFWKLQDEAEALFLDAERKSQELENKLQEALAYDSQLVEARVALAESCMRYHLKAEREGRDVERVRSEQILCNQLNALPPSHDEHQRLAAYLRGDGVLTLYTEPSDAEVRIYRYGEQNRRLVSMRGELLGRTPLIDVPLEMGRYLLVLHKPGYVDARYPVHIRRQERWDTIPPGETEPLPIPLMPAGSLEPWDCYVPPGWFPSGGALEAANSLPHRRLWMDGYAITQTPVTLRSYLIFLNQLWAEGRRDEALRFAPRMSNDKDRDPREDMAFFVLEHERFVPDVVRYPSLSPEWPVTQVDIPSAQAYAQWISKKTGYTWTLPDELAWEKAARGVDGRLFPWGDFFDPSWGNMIDSRPEAPQIDLVDSWAKDKSPYNVRGMGGNVSDWCSNPFRIEGPRSYETRASSAQPLGPMSLREDTGSGGPLDETSIFTVRGGAWNEIDVYCASASRYGALALGRYDNIGFRILRWI